VRNLNAIRRFLHGYYGLTEPHPSLVGKFGVLFTPIHNSSMPCESTVQSVGKLIIYLIHGEGDLWNTPWFGVSTGLCALCAWISLSRIGRTGSHCGTQVTLISRAHPEHLISWCAASGLAREEGGYMEAQAAVDLTSLILGPAGFITPWP
jgi:hypothetical protein